MNDPTGGTPVQIYRPHAEPAPLHMHLYGGVWVIGNLVTHDADCREICVAAEFDPLRDKGEA